MMSAFGTLWKFLLSLQTSDFKGKVGIERRKTIQRSLQRAPFKQGGLSGYHMQGASEISGTPQNKITMTRFRFSREYADEETIRNL
jgi:hypothetical protein